jgi:parallel beta-helix repeat protein
MDSLSFPLALIVNSQINGTRAGAPPTTGGANIEMGGPNSGQLIEYVHSYDPRGWSCLHVAEGSLNCNNTTVQNNDIGPAGSDLFQQWADGISVACSNSLVRNNMVNNPTDGGIVLFGSPGTRVENNTIWVETVSVHFSCLFVSSSRRCRIHC